MPPWPSGLSTFRPWSAKKSELAGGIGPPEAAPFQVAANWGGPLKAESITASWSGNRRR